RAQRAQPVVSFFPPRRGEGWLPRVERAKRAQPVESVANMDSAPEGRRLVATGGASKASATRGQRCPIFFPPRRGGGWLPRVKRAQRAQPVVSGAQSFSRPGGAKDGCHGWSERSERNPWKANETRPGG